jgi:hypothetical protein
MRRFIVAVKLIEVDGIKQRSLAERMVYRNVSYIPTQERYEEAIRILTENGLTLEAIDPLNPKL